VTLNDLEQRSLIALISLNPLQAYCVTVIENRPILSAEYHLPLLAKTDPPCSAVSLR